MIMTAYPSGYAAYHNTVLCNKNEEESAMIILIIKAVLSV